MLVRKRGHRAFRQRVACATLGGRPLRIDGIREDSEEPGLRDYEASLLRLVDKLSNGMRLEINETGTTVRYYPGIVQGGRVEHDCGLVKAVPWFLEAVLPICLFAKRPVTLALEGLTNSPDDVSIDTVRAALLPVLARFGVEEGVSLEVKRRGAPPNGGGLVELRLPVVRELQPVELVDAGLIKRVRGTAYAARVSPQTPNRVVDSCRFVGGVRGSPGGALRCR